MCIRDSLEGEQPLVVSERERRNRVREHVAVAAGGHAVLTQQPAALLVWQQVPVVRAHERIHADVTERALPREKRRHVRAVELGGSVHADVRPHRLEPPCALLEHGTVRLSLIHI